MRHSNTRVSSLRGVLWAVVAVAALLVLDYTISARHRNGTDGFAAHIAIAAACTMVAGILGAIVFALRTRKRVGELVEKLRLVAAGDYTARAEVAGIDEFGELGRAFNSMVGALARARDLLIEKANTDSVTGLYNHRYFQERLAVEFSRAIRYPSSLSLLMIDIDHFKLFNDMNGHPAGDHALREIAAIISGQVRDVDVAARYGGEEFAIILPETSANQAEVLAHRIRESVDGRVFEQTNPQCCKLTLSIGVGEFPSHCSDRASLLRAADGALYQAKMRGRNTVVIFDGESGGDPKPDPHKLYVLLHATDLTTVEALAAAIDAKHGHPSGHSVAIARLAAELGAKLGMSDEARTSLYVASLLRDVGQIAIPDSVLEKSDRLSEDEMKLVEKHPSLGHAIVQKSPYMAAMLPAILHHHEHFDGSGYPDQLVGDKIPLAARIIALADAYQSMMVDRPYRGKLDPAAAQSELERLAGTQFDPEVVKTFLQTARERLEKAA
jgi:diguanylate cyclase (GGDEF)-like protein